jgi:hypothetical protein
MLNLGFPTVLNTSIRGFNTDTDTDTRSQYCSFAVFIYQNEIDNFHIKLKKKILKNCEKI